MSAHRLRIQSIPGRKAQWLECETTGHIVITVTEKITMVAGSQFTFSFSLLKTPAHRSLTLGVVHIWGGSSHLC